MGRISIAGLLGFVAVFAIGLAALVNATFVWAGVVFTLTIGLLFASVLAVILRGWRGGGWLGFALFGWGFLLFSLLCGLLSLSSYTWTVPDAAAEWVFLKSNPAPKPPAPPVSPPPLYVPPPPASSPVAPAMSLESSPEPSLTPPMLSPYPSQPTPEASAYTAASEAHEERLIHAKNISHWLWLLLIAEVGAILGILFARGRRSGEAAPAPTDQTTAGGPSTTIPPLL